MKPTSVRSSAGEVLKSATLYFRVRAAFITRFEFLKGEETNSSENLLSKVPPIAGTFTLIWATVYFFKCQLLIKKVSIDCELVWRCSKLNIRTLFLPPTATAFGTSSLSKTSPQFGLRLQHGDLDIRTDAIKTLLSSISTTDSGLESTNN